MDAIDAATERQTTGPDAVDDVDAGKTPAETSTSPPKPSMPESDPKSTDRTENSKKGEVKKPKKTDKTKSKKPKKSVLADTSTSASDDSDDSNDSSESSEDDDDGLTKVAMSPQQLQAFQQWSRTNDTLPYSLGLSTGDTHAYLPPPPRRRIGGVGSASRRMGGFLDADPFDASLGVKRSPAPSKKRNGKVKLDYKRVDQVWDSSIHNYKLQETAETTTDSQYDGFVLQIRRTFDWEGKYKTTIVDIKSKILRECLQDVIGNIKGVSLFDEVPRMDPNLLFLYLEDLRAYSKKLKKQEPRSSEKKARKKQQKHIDDKRMHLKVLLKYLDKDYAHIKKSLYPMLENGLITFDLLWALFKPNTLVYTTTYGTADEPRIFKVEQTERHNSMMKGEFYWVDGKYFEFDGKQFGYGSFSEEIGEFRGAKTITSLKAYPLDYHKDKETFVTTLIERGKKFVKLGGVHYQSHEGLAYYKKKKSVIKVNINSRVMVDPSIHRRINPNYQVSAVRPKDHDILSDDEAEDDDSQKDSDEAGCCDSDSDACEKMVVKVVKDDKGNACMVRVPKSEVEDENASEQPLVRLEDGGDKNEGGAKTSPTSPKSTGDAQEVPEFSDEEYLIASPVVLGFSFSEKLWLEFTVSGIKDIQWNESAYESLVLEPKQKDIVQALVESHKYHASKSIDDVIQGKGKGLVAVLHGPPGTGKTLTAEGISELLKCPLYMVSAGELGTDSRILEQELQKILDICHAWGSILLLDEADVFLEKRNLHEISRNALVSIFLRQLEYFQGILFLTTNRVETFDDAFQSRIHIALRYESLTVKAKKKIFKIFIERVRVMEKVDLMPFTEEDYNDLAKHDLNGRQIKNTIGTAQALAVNRGEALSMAHIRQVLDVQNSFDIHLKGGTGYQDALRSYY
ncbi:26S proteasome regulatory subunit 4 [Colletotrichum tropicale]|nr:26S proteasome regulatory subunit 4 [Colletotrichum tropicale]